MLPEITIFGRTVSMYGMMAVTAIVAALAFILARSPAFALDRENAFYIACFGGVGAMLGAKALYLVTVFPALVRDLPLLKTDPRAFSAAYITGGMVFYGGLFGAILGAEWAARQYRVRLSDNLPMLMPAFALAHGIARIGCFCAGCCHGVESARFGIAYSVSKAAPNGVPFLPTQLIEAGAEFLIFAFLLWFTAKPARRPFTLSAYLLCYAPVRFVLEFWRGDAIRGMWGGLSTSQWISLAVLAGCAALLSRKKLKK
jgi:phosphatidylglycerol:prolipoprotein diacylglycerol transferase